MKFNITNYEITIQIGENEEGLPNKIIIMPEDSSNPFAWIYTKTETVEWSKYTQKRKKK